MHFARFSSFLKKIALKRIYDGRRNWWQTAQWLPARICSHILYLYLYTDSVSIDRNLPEWKISIMTPPFSRHIWEVIRIVYEYRLFDRISFFVHSLLAYPIHPPPLVYSNVKVNWSDARNGYNEITPAFQRIMARKCDKRLFSVVEKILRISFLLRLTRLGYICTMNPFLCE